MKNRLFATFAVVAALTLGSISMPAVARDKHWSPVQSHSYHDRHNYHGKQQKRHHYNKQNRNRYNNHWKYPRNYYRYRAQRHNHYRRDYYYQPYYYRAYSVPRIIFGFGF